MALPPTVLITGGAGFLGQACARSFQAAGWRVAGIGRRRWTLDEALAAGYDHWINENISIEALTKLREKFQVVVHCAGNGSVPYSLQKPLDSFENTVSTTAALLEYLRLHAPAVTLLYPSSAAVYGAADDRPLVETDTPKPVSPYGYHKLMVESLLAAHAHSFSQPAFAVRFFSIYGPGLRKQLLWDASLRLLSGDSPQIFWGTGHETRDWIHVTDAARLFVHLAEHSMKCRAPEGLQVINGGSGIRVTVRNLLERLAEKIGSNVDIRFNGVVRRGDPCFYQASIEQLNAMGWCTSISLDEGISSYVSWIKEER